MYPIKPPIIIPDQGLEVNAQAATILDYPWKSVIPKLEQHLVFLGMIPHAADAADQSKAAGKQHY